MDSAQNTGRDIYRLLVTRRNASEILLSRCGSGWTLPSVGILRGHRIAEQLTAELYAQCGCRGYCLFLPTPASGPSKCAVVEVSQQDEVACAGTSWILLSAATHCSIDSAEDLAIIERSIEELNAYRRDRSHSRFAQPGWLAELFKWVDEQLAPLGLQLTGGFTQWNASPSFSLIRLETNGRAVWFKATGYPNRHELPVTDCLARLFPGYLPRLLGVHATWNAWLTEEVPGTGLDRSADISAWAIAAEDLARLQILSIGRQAKLLECQCKDLRLPRLAEQIDPFVDRMREFMAAQVKPTPAPLTDSELTRLRRCLKRACQSLCEANFPDTLGHLDMSPANIHISPERTVFLDWAEACVANPLITLEYFREHSRRALVSDPTTTEHLVAAYCRPWQGLVSPAVWKQAAAVSPLVAAFAYAAATNAWRSSDALSQRSLLGYFRSLTRRMYREAEGMAPRSERCYA